MKDQEEQKKVHFQRWEGKIHPYQLPMHYEAVLMELDADLLEIEEILREGGMEGLGYQSQEVRTIGEGIGALNAYIGTLVGEIDRQIDQPLYKGFQNDATELLSRIKLENYETENTLKMHTRHKMANEYGDPYAYDSIEKLTFADFLGTTGIDKGNKSGTLVNMPEEFQAFTNMFALEYDRIKGELADPDGSPMDLESYLKMLHDYGEFDNKMNKPVLEFVSGLLDIIFIKPLIEMCIGYDLITGEDLSDFERGMKSVFALVDMISMRVGIKASGVAKLFGKKSLQLAGKTMLVSAMSYSAAYGVGKLGEELGLPCPVTLLLSLGAGVTVARVGSRYVFTDSTGKILLEADVDEVDVLRRRFDQDDIKRLNHEYLDATGNKPLVTGLDGVDKVVEGTTKGPGNISQEIIEKGKKIASFENPADPIRDILGNGMDSHPEEWNKIVKELENSGVEVVYREGVMGYGPLRKGESGQIVIDPNASYSALKHEYSHFIDAKSKGFPSAAEAYQDWEGRIVNELKSYTIEIEEAQKLGLDNVVEQLQKNFEAEKQYIIERYGPIE